MSGKSDPNANPASPEPRANGSRPVLRPSPRPPARTSGPVSPDAGGKKNGKKSDKTRPPPRPASRPLNPLRTPPRPKSGGQLPRTRIAASEQPAQTSADRSQTQGPKAVPGRGRPSSKKVGSAGDHAERKPAPERKPVTIDQLIPATVRHAIKQPKGLGIAKFDEHFFPHIKYQVPRAEWHKAGGAIDENMLKVSHAFYVALVCGQFSARPVLCGVRAAELAGDLAERVLRRIRGKEEHTLLTVRCAGLLTGLTLMAVRLIESTNLDHEDLGGFTDNFERAMITTYGLKNQAEATGLAPWGKRTDNPLQKRVNTAINRLSQVFGDYIGAHAAEMDDERSQAVLAEFDFFMERFAPYIEGGRNSAVERARALAKNLTGVDARPEKVEPLDIEELRTRPAGVEIRLRDRRILFVSTEDARHIGAAADSEVYDTSKMNRDEIQARKQAAMDEIAIIELDESEFLPP